MAIQSRNSFLVLEKGLCAAGLGTTFICSMNALMTANQLDADRMPT